MVGATINAQSSIAALTRYGYTMGSNYIVNRFNGRGSWQDDMLQAGASTLAMIASSALLSDDTDIGKFVGSRNSTLAMQRFMQGTFENMLLATGGMWIGSNKGQSFGDILLSQNWQKTQYTLSDYAVAKLSEYCKDRGKDHAEKARKAMEDMDRKEVILGLGWLGLRKVESVLGSAIDGIIQWIDQNVQDVVRGVQNTGQRVVNWLKGGKWVTNEEKLQIAVEAAMAEYARRAKEAILESFYKDTREKTDAKIDALKAAGVDTADIEARMARLRKQLEERKQKNQAVAQKKAEQVKEAGVDIADIMAVVVGFWTKIVNKKLITGVQYHSQRDNKTSDGEVNGSNMCNLTSLAMVMEYRKIDIGIKDNSDEQYEDKLYEIAKGIKLGGENLLNNTGEVYLRR